MHRLLRRLLRLPEYRERGPLFRSVLVQLLDQVIREQRV
jgi:hypothetical protein